MLKKIKNLLILQCIFGFGSLALILVFAILHIYSDTPNFYIFYYVFIIVFLVYLIGFIFYTVYSLNKILKTKNENAARRAGAGFRAQFRTSRNALWAFRASSGLFEHGILPRPSSGQPPFSFFAQGF